MPFSRQPGARRYFRLEGNPSGPPLVLVHPIGADHGFWNSVMPQLSQEFRVLRYDLPGHGASDLESDASIDSLSAGLIALADYAGFERFAVGGTSIGAMVALRTAATHLVRITSVFTCSVAPKLAPPPGGWDGRARTALEKGMTSLSGPMVERMFKADFRNRHPAEVAAIRHVFEHTDPAGYAALCNVLGQTDLSPDLIRVKCPVLSISGSEDPLCPADVTERLVAALPSASSELLMSGHYPSVECPEEFAAAMMKRA